MSKPDGITFNFCFNGKELEDLKLPFSKARIIILLRARMFPTRANFPGRWQCMNCVFWQELENDEHLFVCPGYTDITEGSLKYNLFFNLKEEKAEIDQGNEKLLKIHDRLATINN